MNSFVYNTLAYVEKNDFLFILWILFNALELDANIVNFVYYGKTRLHSFLITQQGIFYHKRLLLCTKQPRNNVSLNDDNNNGDQKVFQMKDSRPFPDRCMGYIVNNFRGKHTERQSQIGFIGIHCDAWKLVSLIPKWHHRLALPMLTLGIGIPLG